ncbi:hypothetical protein TL16_g05437 [Triparma laevis f. inornata]|uniref:Uncharacterized protein n=1 Tax=Triparma laevis f. inornata TaxID=1714386 RepID=A0A9W7ALL4_9STRA|nr:hypothetical protein TL16_g05437 [Triparma laevis f. inornata]
MAVYAITMFKTVGGGDSGEIVASACAQAPSHPPGYPLLLMLNGIFMKFAESINLGDTPAYRANIFNAMLGAAAATGCLVLSLLLVMTGNAKDPQSISKHSLGLLEEVENLEALDSINKGGNKGGKRGKKMKGGSNKEVKDVKDNLQATTTTISHLEEPLPDTQFFACLCAATCFAFSKGIWEYCTQAEVFPLNNLLCSILLSTTLCFLHISPLPSGLLTGKQKRLAVFGGFVCGLCICNQHTSSIYIFVCVLSVANGHEMALLNRERKTLIFTAVATIGGLMPYYYLVIRANAHAVDGWGDQRTLRGILRHFLREEYGTFVLASEWESGEEQTGDKFIRRCSLFLTTFSSESLHIGIPSLVVFLYYAVTHKNNAAQTIFMAYVFYTLFFNYLANLTFSQLHVNILGRMWQQSTVAGFAMSGAGLGKIGLKLEGKLGGKFGVTALFALLGLIQIQRNYGEMDRSYVTVFSEYATNVLNNLPPNATLMTNDDMNCNTLHYMVRCENPRPDVNVLKIPLITYDWWKPMQIEHFPNVKGSFSGRRHHPFDKDGFNMKEFLDVNVGVSGKPELYVLGDWKKGDKSQDVYKKIPVGLADLIVRPESVEMDLYEYAKMLEVNLVDYDDTRNIVTTPGSWETVMSVKYQNFYLLSSHHIATKIQTTLSPSDPPEKKKQQIYVCQVGLKAYNLLLNITDLKAGPEDDLSLQRSAWRNAGVVSGILGNLHKSLNDTESSTDGALEMFKFWDVFIESCLSEEDMEERDCREIAMFVDHGVNPYSNEKFKGKEGFEIIKKYDGLHDSTYKKKINTRRKD